MAVLQISDFDSQGVTLMPATEADFDLHAEAILGGYAAPVLQLKPYLAIVRNENPRTVVAYTVSWTAIRRNGTSEVDYTQFKFPDAVAGATNGLSVLQGREIRRGDQRLVGMGFEAWPPEYADRYRDFGVESAMRLGEVQGLRIALDAVIFEDGGMLGPDESRLAEHFVEFLHAKQSLYRDIVVGLENGDVGDDVFAALRGILKARPAPQHQGRSVGYGKQAATEILGFHDRIVLEVFRRTLRREPFAIRRLS